MTPVQPNSDEGILCCDVGAERFAFRSRDVRHVERAEYLRIDRGDDGRLGLLKLGGQQVPVFALDEIFGRAQRTSTGDGHIAVTGQRHAMTGWLVDRIARAAQPVHGDIAPLPPIVGAPATSWFEGVVWLDEHESALLLAPHRLLSSPAVADEAADELFAQPQATQAVVEPEPVAVVFSTPVLPPCGVRRYALSGRQIAAIVQPTPSIAIPGCKDPVNGVMWWRRTVVPVIDFRDARRDAAPQRQLIAQCGTRHRRSLVAFAIDSEVMMCRPGADHRLLPDADCPPFASGVFDVNGEAVALLNLDALLAAEAHAGAA